ncbi:MAG: sulfur carrier protein ThiS [Phycisphaerales bacterium]|jgi:sulfur carrier protein|nr:sulfur carrier protein ThiS [Phycisphaerales bacterium]
MTITVNGDERVFQEPQTISELIRDLGLEGRPCAVERNRMVVPKAEHDSTMLAEGDQLEVVTLVGGG